MTLAPTQKNDVLPMKTQINAGGGFIPKGSQGVEVAKDFLDVCFYEAGGDERQSEGRSWPLVPDDPVDREERSVVAHQR